MFSAQNITDLEVLIDKHTEGLPPLKNFILPVSGSVKTLLHAL